MMGYIGPVDIPRHSRIDIGLVIVGSYASDRRIGQAGRHELHSGHLTLQVIGIGHSEVGDFVALDGRDGDGRALQALLLLLRRNHDFLEFRAAALSLALAQSLAGQK